MMQQSDKVYTFSCHTDLAVELKEEMEKRQELTGVDVLTRSYRYHGIEETHIEIKNEEGANLIGKPVGHYVTLEMKHGRKKTVENKLAQIIADVLSRYGKEADNLLVVGLGNHQVTPDALGPQVLDKLAVTRHLIRYGYSKNPHQKRVSALCPGVMAQTGMETLEIVKGVAEELKPDLILVIDALAARNCERLNRTIQLCDTGISPGAGVGNNRQEMNEQTLGVKVIAIGVPTVIAVPTILCDALAEYRNQQENADKETFRDLTWEEQFALARNLMEPYFTDLFVTPKNIDEEIAQMSSCIARGINAYTGGGLA